MISMKKETRQAFFGMAIIVAVFFLMVAIVNAGMPKLSFNEDAEIAKLLKDTGLMSDQEIKQALKLPRFDAETVLYVTLKPGAMLYVSDDYRLIALVEVRPNARVNEFCIKMEILRDQRKK